MDPLFLAYAVPFGVIVGTYLLLSRRADRRSRETLDAAKEAGLNEPASLHPVIDHAKCVGCGACVRACPEGSIIGLVAGRAELLEPSSCIGHGACRAACPIGAISLVFGTATRGVDIPQVNADFETNIPGIFIAGELGGMGLIRNAVEQGRRAIEGARRRGRAAPGVLDVLIVGAGPAGLAASLAATEHGLSYVTLEQETFGGTIAHYPRSKLVMTAPARLPLVGKLPFREVSKEALMAFWSDVAHKTRLVIRAPERVEAIEATADGFAVRTAHAMYRARSVVLAIGRRGTPRRLDVEGEDLPKVVYSLVDASQYRGRSVLVVGGGDSAIEAAVSLAEETGTRVTLAYRGPAFARAKPKNRERAAAASRAGRLSLAFSTQVRRIDAESVALERDGEISTIANDAVIVCAGGILPTAFLKSIGIEVETKHGAA